MKKIYYLLFILLAMALIFPVPALALTETVSWFQIGNNNFYTDGMLYEMDGTPFVKDGRTFIPVRYLANSIGIGIYNDGILWDEENLKVTLVNGATSVEMFIGSTELYVNGSPRSMDVAPLLKDGRVYLPARYIANAFDYSVDWNEENSLVSIIKEPVDLTYTDAENHFSLQYPSNWDATKADTLGVVLDITSPPEDGNDDFSENILVLHLIDPSIKNITLDELVASEVQNQINHLPRFEVYENGDGFLDGVPSKYVKARCNNGNTDYCVEQIITKIQDEYFVINFSVKEDKVSLYDGVIDNVVNSFKILEAARKVLPAGVVDYSGDWGRPDFEGLIHPNGKGKLYYTNGDEYQGDLKNGIRDGYGSYTWKNQEYYSGEWKNDMKDGEGTLYYHDPVLYLQRKTGIWQNDEFIKETPIKNRHVPIDYTIGP